MLNEIQQKLKAPKSQTNKFGGYRYRSAEDILEAAKKVCAPLGVSVVIKDDLELIGDRYYVKATVRLMHSSDTLVEGQCIAESHAYAREAASRKGMDDAQCTGSSSSYARKYALQGIFALDDSAFDPDAVNDHGKGEAPKAKVKPPAKKAKPKAEPKPKEEPKSNPDLITPAQRKRLFATATECGIDNGMLKELVVAVCGCESTKDIRKKCFDSLLKAIEGTLPEAKLKELQDAQADEDEFNRLFPGMGDKPPNGAE